MLSSGVFSSSHSLHLALAASLCLCRPLHPQSDRTRDAKRLCRLHAVACAACVMPWRLPKGPHSMVSPRRVLRCRLPRSPEVSLPASRFQSSSVQRVCVCGFFSQSSWVQKRVLCGQPSSMVQPVRSLTPAARARVLHIGAFAASLA